MTLWCGVGGIIPISLEVQRTIKRAEIWALQMTLCKTCGPSENFADNRGVVQALTEGVVDCITAGHIDADLWVLVWSKVGECIEEGFNMKVAWTKAHTTLQENTITTPENRQVAWANEKADELAKTGTIQDGAAVSERIVPEALDTRKRVCLWISDMPPPSMMECG